ncbi:hypothetical protein LJR230_003677 [Trinickia sp. LjRoot230]|uniref:hypothetical protein n=1 Tax=Trinickia sp. LjRoot230 TaxID=3342288 RepID=UPI003ECF2DFF
MPVPSSPLSETDAVWRFPRGAGSDDETPPRKAPTRPPEDPEQQRDRPKQPELPDPAEVGEDG